MQKSLLSSVLVFVVWGLAGGVAEAGSFVSPPIETPGRGTGVSISQLTPVGAFDMFATDLRNSLQEGVVPDKAVILKASRAYDGRYYGLYPDFLRLVRDHYAKATADYLRNVKRIGLTEEEIEEAILTVEATLAHVDKMETEAAQALHDRVTEEQRAFDRAIRRVRTEIENYKGKPSALGMPFAHFASVGPVGAVPRDLDLLAAQLESLAAAQLRAVGDHLGSGSNRSNQWILLLRGYRQGTLNFQAAASALRLTASGTVTTIPNF